MLAARDLAPRGAGVAPVRGGTYFLCCAPRRKSPWGSKESRQRKPLDTLPRPFRVMPQWHSLKWVPRSLSLVVRDEIGPRLASLSDKGLAHPVRTACSRFGLRGKPG